VTTPSAAAPRGRIREGARAALAPLLCAAALIALLSGWVLAGGAGTLTRVRIEVTTAAVPMPSFTGTSGQPVRPYLVVRNLSGQPDALLSARTPAAARVRLTSGRGSLVTSTPVTVPARGTLTLSPFGEDLVLIRPHALQAGRTVPLTLVFRHAGAVTVTATVTPPGTP